MTILDEMTLYWSQQVSSDIANETIAVIDSKKDLFSNDKNCLNSDWEGFCVEVQEQVSILDQGACVEQIDALFRIYYDLLPKEEQFTLWLQTPKGKEWVSNVENQFTYKNAPVVYVDCRELLMTVLTQAAMDYESDGITRYISYVIRGEQTEEDDFEEEEEDYDA